MAWIIKWIKGVYEWVKELILRVKAVEAATTIEELEQIKWNS